MGPVSFTRFSFANRDDAMEAARTLAAAGLRLQSVDGDTTLLIRTDDATRARALLDPGTGTKPVDDSVRPVEPLSGPFDTVINLPGSKSHTNRALLCAGLARGRSDLRRVLLADDTQAMIEALDLLGVTLDRLRDEGPVHFHVIGVGPSGFTALGSPPILDVRQSGTTGRFLLPALATGNGSFILDGAEQMRHRPFGPQLAALRELGADIGGETLPLSVSGRRLRGGPVAVSGDMSSQFLSGLLMAAPYFARPTEIRLESDLVSRPYVELTLHTMAAFGIDVAGNLDEGWFRIPTGSYRAASIDLEPDASAASYFFAAAAMTGSRVRVEGLGRSTVQGDLRFVDVLARMGADVAIGDHHTTVTGTGRLQGVTVDMADLSDTAQTLAVVAACADSPSEVTGIGFIRHKETDRIAATVTELQGLGIDAESTDDGFIIRPGTPRGGLVATYDDHRMAMSFALLGLRHPGIVIDDPACVNKTFPDYFEVLSGLEDR